VKPFYLSSETVLPIKPFYLSNSTCTATPRGAQEGQQQRDEEHAARQQQQQQPGQAGPRGRRNVPNVKQRLTEVLVPVLNPSTRDWTFNTRVTVGLCTS
jgi:hypothetical protein